MRNKPNTSFLVTVFCTTLLMWSTTNADLLPGAEENVTPQELMQVIRNTADATLFPNGLTTRSNCRQDAHCVVLPFPNNCEAALFSNYKSRGAEEAINDMMVLLESNFAGFFDAGCTEDTLSNLSGVCLSDNRCAFVPVIEFF